jgi:hypothetical protein
MTKCARCSSETEMYEIDVPICIACADKSEEEKRFRVRPADEIATA